MTTKAFDRWVVLPPDCNFVPVKKIERLLCAACEASMAGRSAEDAEAMGFDFGGRVDQDYILRMVLERRNTGLQRVFGTDGLGVIRDDDVLGGVCCVPCDHIPLRSWSLFKARDVMRGVIESFKTESIQ